VPAIGYMKVSEKKTRWPIAKAVAGSK